MSSIWKTLTGRPWALTTTAVAMVAVAMLLVPVSYERAVGQDVALEVRGTDLDRSRVHAIAREFQRELGVAEVHLSESESESEGRRVYTLHTMVPKKNQVNSKSVANAFASTLNEQGFPARATVTPRMERISGTVYAMARDRVIRVAVDGKSDAELESEIRQRLLEAGVHDPTVEVSTGDDTMTLNITSEYDTDDPNHSGKESGRVDVVLTDGGADLVPSGDSMDIQERVRIENGVETRIIEVWAGGREATVEIPNAEALSDASLAAEVRNQLLAQGIEVAVVVVEGKLTLEKR